jgi:hypothetical protein
MRSRTVPIEWKDADVRPGVSADEAKKEITAYVKDHPGKDALDIADGLRLGFLQVETLLDELILEGIVIGSGDGPKGCLSCEPDIG